MIIKSKRVKAKGAALKRLLRHVTNGDDNDFVSRLQGNVANLEDARSDALRLGREYAVRHWILSPELKLTPAQLAYLIALLAAEFGFDPKEAVVWKHHKPRASEDACEPRASEDACEEHFHVLVREVDAITGGVMSSNHNFKRHEKLARLVEVAWGHKLTRGAHNRAVASALTGGENANVVTAMTEAGLLDAPKPVESFAEDEHQRAKREGLDLPQLRIMISEALSASESQTDFATRLAAVGLRIRTGEKADTPIVETVDRVLVGSLARLTRLRKAALLERLKFNVGKQLAVETHDSRSHLSVAQTAHAGYGSDREIGCDGRSSGSAASDDGGDRTPAAIDGRRRADLEPLGGAGIPAGRSGGEKSPEGRCSQLRFLLGCASHQGTLLDLLAVARRTAQGPLDRVIGDLDEAIERNTSIANRTFACAEPTSLLLIRKVVKASQQRLRALESEADAIVRQLSTFPPSSAWRRFWYRRETRTRKALNAKLTKQLASVQRSAREHALLEHRQDAEIKSFQVARAKHEVDNEKHIEKAKRIMVVASSAKAFIRQNPHFATWGSARLMEVAAQIEKIRSERIASEDSDQFDEGTFFLPV